MCPLAPSSPTPLFDFSVRLYPYFHRFYGVRFRSLTPYTAPVDTSTLLVLSFFVSSLHCPGIGAAVTLWRNGNCAVYQILIFLYFALVQCKRIR